MTGISGALVGVCFLLTAQPSGEPSPMASRSERIEHIFNALNKDTMDLLDDFYATEVIFEDPLGRIEGLDELRRYYENLYQGAMEIAFDFHAEVIQDQTHVVVWTMRLKAKRLRRGKEISVDGNSLIRFNEEDKVIYHRDYFDMGAFIYENVPLVGCAVKKIKKRLKH